MYCMIRELSQSLKLQMYSNCQCCAFAKILQADNIIVHLFRHYADCCQNGLKNKKKNISVQGLNDKLACVEAFSLINCGPTVTWRT